MWALIAVIAAAVVLGLASEAVSFDWDYPADVFSLSPTPTGEGPSVTVRGHFNRNYDHLIPGERTSRVMTEVGAIYLHLPGRGIVVHYTGSVTFAPGRGFEVITGQHGVRDVSTTFRVRCSDLRCAHRMSPGQGHRGPSVG